MSKSTQATPIRNGTTVTYIYTFKDQDGTVIPITSLSVTWIAKVPGYAAWSGVGSVSNGPGGVATADIPFVIENISSKITGRYHVLAVNVQFFAGDYEGQPQIEYVGPGIDDLSSTSTLLLES